LQKSAKKLNLPSSLLIDNQKFDTNSKQNLNKICKYFATIVASMSKKFSQIDNPYLKIYSKRSIKSFVFHEISEEVSTCINNIKTYSAPGDLMKFPPNL